MTEVQPVLEHDLFSESTAISTSLLAAILVLCRDYTLKQRLQDLTLLKSHSSIHYFLKAIARIARNDYVPTAYKIDMLNQLELEREKVYVKNFTFAKTWPTERDIKSWIPHSDIAKKFIFVIDLSEYDEMVERDAEDQHDSCVTLWLAADMI
ncbi:hypothetical protein G7Y79_00004g015370 [Physcia stellaris]|nr:hypothetical protein G7Y79_00004g015370 [Physcia stellaris]